MKKRSFLFLSLLSLLLLAFSCGVSAEIADGGICGENVSWTLTDDGTLTVSGEGAMDQFVNVESCPWYHERESVERVVVEAGVTSVGSFAFSGCTALSGIDLANTVRSIGDDAFKDCARLTAVSLPSGLTSLGNGAFYNCSGLTSLTIPAGVTTLGDFVFSGCSGLRALTLPDSVREIGDCAFLYCNLLNSVALSANNPYFSLDAYGMLFDENRTKLVQCFDREITAYTLPATVKTIGGGAFAHCGALRDITVPAAVTEIGPYAFYQCGALPEFTIPAGVTFIGDCAFNGCYGLTDITVPEGVTAIGEGAFTGCSALTSVSLPNTLKTIGEAAFSSCSALTELTIPDSVTEIGWYAFNYCGSLTELTIPAAVTALGERVFIGCSELRDIHVAEDNPALLSEDGVLFNKDQTALIFCPIKKSGAYTLPASVEAINEYAFESCVDLSEVTLSPALTFIGEGAFYNCSGLTKADMGENVDYIGEYAFSGCTALKSVDLPRSLAVIEAYAFYNCAALKDIAIPGEVGFIGECAFNGCKSLTAVTIPSAVRKIENNVFSGCTALSDVTVAEGVEEIGLYAFFGCAALKSVSLPQSVTSVGDSAFSHCTALTAAVVPNAETTFAEYVFYDCPDLILYGRKDSAAEDYAAEQNIDFVGLFDDVTDGKAFYFAPVYWAYLHEPQITKGTSETRFSPSAACSRGQVVTFLWRAEGEPEPRTTKNPFKDVKATDYFYKAVLWAAENGVTSGTSATTFSPNQTCTRGQVVSFLHRVEGEPAPSSQGNPFKDVKATDYFYKAVLWAAESGVTSGTSANTFSPSANCTRGQVVTFLYRDLAE